MENNAEDIWVKATDVIQGKLTGNKEFTVNLPVTEFENFLPIPR